MCVYVSFQVGQLSDMLTAPEGFPKCGNYIPPVANPPIRVLQKPKTIIPLTNETNPHHPQYKVNGMSTTAKPKAPKASGTGRKPGKSAAGSLSSNHFRMTLNALIVFLATYVVIR